MAYCTVNDVEAELGFAAGTITGATTPTSTTVSGWISDAEDEVDMLSGQVYATAAVSSTTWEYHDYDGSGVLKLDNYPVQSIEKIQYEENGLGADTESWVDLVGSGIVATTNYQLYGDVGAIRFHANSTGNNPIVGHQNIRVAYTYGHTSVPRQVKSLVAKMVAKRYIQSVANKAGTTEGGAISVGAISISDPNNYVINRLEQLDKDIAYLQERVVGKFRVVNYNLNLYG